MDYKQSHGSGTDLKGTPLEEMGSPDLLFHMKMCLFAARGVLSLTHAEVILLPSDERSLRRKGTSTTYPAQFAHVTLPFC